jgi:hypothetical protein
MKLIGLFCILVLSAVPHAAAQSCDIPASYTNTTSIVEGDYWIGFATDKSVYTPGELIAFYLVVTNTGATTQSFNFGLTPEDAYAVMPSTCTSLWDCEDTLYDYPPIVYYYNPGVTLEPGECRVWTHTSTVSPFDASHVEETFNVQGGLITAIPTAGWALPTGGVSLTVHVQTVATDESSWGAVKAIYQ